MRTIVSALVFLFIFVPVVAHGQFFFGTVTLSGTPTDPKPQEIVSMEITGFLADLNQSIIYWFENGELVSQGVGLTSHDVNAGDVGKLTIVGVAVQTPSGTVLRDDYIIIPENVVVVWEALTYTPPLYKGKALYTDAASVRVVALPQFFVGGQKIPDSELLYTWQERGRVIGKTAQRGNNVIVINDVGVARDLFVSVEVTTPDDNIRATAGVSVPIHEPEIVLYKRHPLLGVQYNNAFEGQFESLQEEVTLRAEPYFFSDDIGTVEYTWLINNADTNVSGPEIVLTPNENVASAVINVSAVGLNNFLQNVRKTFTVSFNQ